MPVQYPLTTYELVILAIPVVLVLMLLGWLGLTVRRAPGLASLWVAALGVGSGYVLFVGNLVAKGLQQASLEWPLSLSLAMCTVLLLLGAWRYRFEGRRTVGMVVIGAVMLLASMLPTWFVFGCMTTSVCL